MIYRRKIVKLEDDPIMNICNLFRSDLSDLHDNQRDYRMFGYKVVIQNRKIHVLHFNFSF